MEKRKRMTLTEIDRVPDFGVVQSDSDVDREILFKQANTLRSDMRSIIGVLKAENAELRERIKGLEEALEAYGNHSSKCLLSQYREGRPTEGRGYETLYGYGDKAKWYRDGERPECTCGFDAALAGGKE